MEIIQDLIAKGKANRPAGSNTMKYITIHNTDNVDVGADAHAHAKMLKTTVAKVSWHYSVDGKSIYQHIPDNEPAWHTGTNKGNTQSIGIEICVNKGGDLKQATENAVWLVAMLLKKHKLPIDKVVQHNFWNSKNCPSYIRAGKPYDWATFVAKVKEYDDMDFKEAVDILAGKKIIGSPTYWKAADKFDKLYVEKLIISMAKFIEKGAK